MWGVGESLGMSELCQGQLWVKEGWLGRKAEDQTETEGGGCIREWCGRRLDQAERLRGAGGDGFRRVWNEAKVSKDCSLDYSSHPAPRVFSGAGSLPKRELVVAGFGFSPRPQARHVPTLSEGDLQKPSLHRLPPRFPWRRLWLHGDQGLRGKEEASQAIMGIWWLTSSVYCSEHEVTSPFAWQLMDERFLRLCAVDALLHGPSWTPWVLILPSHFPGC